MFKKFLILLVVSAIAFGALYLYLNNNKKVNLNIVSPIGIISQEGNNQNKQQDQPKKSSIFSEVINILLIGTDTSESRRADGQTGFNTDSMVLVSINTRTNKVLLTSVPRDVWINGNKINALYIVFGWDTLRDAYEKITGQKIDGYVKVDFDQFRWLVDAFGGVPVTVEKTFTDTTFPNKTDSGVITASFTQGYEKMNSDRALTFARSRHGDNGEGSDLKRAKRQHLLLQGFVEAVKQPESLFWPMDVSKFYDAITGKSIYTTLKLDDLYYLWDFYKDKDKYSVESLVLDDKYIYHPGMYPDSEYRAWVFISKDPTWGTLHADIKAMLDGTFKYETQEPAPVPVQQ